MISRRGKEKIMTPTQVLLFHKIYKPGINRILIFYRSGVKDEMAGSR
jgi:hypothetical protein